MLLVCTWRDLSLPPSHSCSRFINDADPSGNPGRYNKYSRRVSQTPWLIDGQRKTAISVEEAIGNVVQKYFRADGTVPPCHR